MMAESKAADSEKSMQKVESTSSGLTYQSITETESQKALAAYKEFEKKNFEECLKILKSLRLSRPNDNKVVHNIYVADFFRLKCCYFIDLYTNMVYFCEKANITVHSITSMDDVDHCVLFFNRSVVLYHLCQYRGAILILDKVFQFVEPLDETLSRRICLLLLELYLCTHQPKKALSVIGYIETMLLSGGSSNKSNKSPEKDETKGTSSTDEIRLRLVQSKARCYAMMKTAKPCKREVKTLMVSGSKAQHIAAFFIKSQLEYQRGNYRKAIKILNSPEWPEDYTVFLMETGNCLQAIYYNNLSCIHYYMAKPGLGAFYAERGLRELNDTTAKIRVKNCPSKFTSQPMYTYNYAVQKKLIYNVGMQHFQQQKYQDAFDYFMKVSDCYSDNPRLWLRLAECCIQIYLCREDVIASKQNNPVKDVIGEGENRKIILSPGNESLASRLMNEPCSKQLPTMSFAMFSLLNALMLMPKEKLSEGEEESSSSKQDDEKDANPLEENSLHCLPCNSIPLSDVQALKNSILAALSYVSLKLGDLSLAHNYAQLLLSQPRISEAHKYVGHMYAGEALVYLDRISQAVEHFKPELFTDISQSLPPTPEETTSKHQAKSDTPERTDVYDKSKLKPTWYPDSLSTARLVAQYNLSVVYAMRGEWSKSLKLVNEVMKDENAPPQAMSLAVYIHLCQGATDVAISYLNKLIPLRQR